MSGGRILCVVETPAVIRRVQLWQVKLTGLDIRVSRLQLITEEAARCTGRDTVVIAHFHFSFFFFFFKSSQSDLLFSRFWSL